jgi:hypothetical protein
VAPTAMKLAAHDTEVKQRIGQFFKTMETRLTQALARAQAAGPMASSPRPPCACYSACSKACVSPPYIPSRDISLQFFMSNALKHINDYREMAQETHTACEIADAVAATADGSSIDQSGGIPNGLLTGFEVASSNRSLRRLRRKPPSS